MKRTLVIVFIVVVTAGGYALLGAPALVLRDAEYRQSVATTQPLVAALNARVRENPKDLAAYATLGQLLMETGKHTASAEAYRHAVLLSGGDPMLILQYNKALIFAAGGQVSDKAAEGLHMVLKLLPGQPEARYFLAIQSLQAGNAEAAMQEMKALYHELPEDSPLKTIINRQIGRE